MVDVAQGKVGEVGAYEVDFSQGDLVVKVGVSAGGVVGGDLVLKLHGGAVLDALAKAIPGSVDDAVLGVVKAALEALK